MTIDLNNWLCLVGVAVILLLACVGLIFITYVFVRFARASDRCFDDLNDSYDGCDPKKVRK